MFLFMFTDVNINKNIKLFSQTLLNLPCTFVPTQPSVRRELLSQLTFQSFPAVGQAQPTVTSGLSNTEQVASPLMYVLPSQISHAICCPPDEQLSTSVLEVDLSSRDCDQSHSCDVSMNCSHLTVASTDTVTYDNNHSNNLLSPVVPQSYLVDRREQLSRKYFYINLTILILSSYPFTYPSGSYNYNSITICKQISTPPQPYQKIPHIYFLRSCPLPNLISFLSPITIQFVFDVFVLYVLCNFYCTALLCYLVL